MKIEPKELVACEACGYQVELQAVEFFEGPGSTWWCACPRCQVLMDPDARAQEQPKA